MSDSHSSHSARASDPPSVPFDSGALYALAISILLGLTVLAASVYFSADGLKMAMVKTQFGTTVNFNSPTGAAGAPPAALAAPAPAPTPSAPIVPTPSPAPGCGVPTQAPSGCGTGAAAIAPPSGQRATIDVAGRPVRGDPNAKVTIVEFSEFLCPYCKRADPTMKQLLNDYKGKVKLVYMHFFIHGEAPKMTSVAAECAGDQGKFWEMHDKIFEAPTTDVPTLKGMAQSLGLDMAKFGSCMDSPAKLAEVNRQHALGQQNGVSGTPSFFINGRLVVGAQPYESFKGVIDQELAS